MYIRQSTTHQLVTNQESLRLQYALRQRARECGWHEAYIDVIDADLGISGASAAQRSGSKELVERTLSAPTWFSSKSNGPNVDNQVGAEGC